MVHMVPFSFTITPPASPPSLAPYPHFTIARKSSETVIDMQRRIDTIASARPSHEDAEDPTESWSTPQSYNLDRAAAIAHKIAQEELALLTPAAVLQLGGNLGSPFEYELDHKNVRFAGLYVVNGPSEARHIRYAMEVSVPELQLRTRCIQRFQSFHQMRQRLLKVTKRCCHHYHQRYNSSASNADSKLASLAATWSELPFTSATRGCRSCRRVRKTLKALAFPRRKVFTTSAVDVRQRSQQLETFLGACTRLLVDWSGCERGKKLFAAVVGKFLGVNILQQLFPSRYGRGSGYSSSLMDNHMEVVRAENGEAAGGGMRPSSDGGFGGSEFAQSVATGGSESSFTTTTTGGGGSGFHVGGVPSCRTLLSTFSSSSSLSLHDEDEYQSKKRSMSEDDGGVAALAQEFHDTGFVALVNQHTNHLMPPDELVARVHDAVLRVYETHLSAARDKQIDLTLLKNAEVLAGFYVRQGGRVDIQISAMSFQKTSARVLAAGDAGSSKTADPSMVIDMAPFQEMARCWQSLVKEILSEEAGDENGSEGTHANYRLEYVGCVVSRPGDDDQNWHLDGVHRSLTKHEKADRLNVFVPLVDLSESVGGTEMKKTSHIRGDGSAFEHYAHLESVTHLVPAGTPVLMDYRVWHRGLANFSTSDTIRPLLYFKYVKIEADHAVDTSGKRKEAAKTADDSTKKKKRVMLTQVTK